MTTALRQVVASNIRALRLRQSLSQEALAERARLHRTYVSAVELGHRNISIDNIAAIAQALDTRPAGLLSDKGDR